MGKNQFAVCQIVLLTTIAPSTKIYVYIGLSVYIILGKFWPTLFYNIATVH